MTFVIGTACVVGGTSSTAALPHLGDGVEHGGQLAGEEIELLVGHRQPGQVRQVRDLVTGELALRGRACSCCGGTPLRCCATARFSAGNVTGPLYVGPSGRRPARNGRERLHASRSTEIGPHLRGRPGGTVSYLLRLVRARPARHPGRGRHRPRRRRHRHRVPGRPGARARRRRGRRRGRAAPRPAARQPDHGRPGRPRRDRGVDPALRRAARHPPRAGAARGAGPRRRGNDGQAAGRGAAAGVPQRLGRRPGVRARRVGGGGRVGRRARCSRA